VGLKAKTEFNAEVDFHVRGMGSAAVQLDASRYRADGGFIYFRGDLAHTQELPLGLQAYGKIQGQIANEPLLSPEQFACGGLGTVRGYLEAETTGDRGVAGTLELRGPDFFNSFAKKDGSEWRVYVFGDAGTVSLLDAPTTQTSRFYLASYGLGARIRLMDHFSGSLDAAMPLIKQVKTQAHDPRLTFRAGIDY
jgi:hemolysin activation/secretion protein